MGEQSRPLERRRAGVLLHVTSLPVRGRGTDSGDLGDGAYQFVVFLAAAGCSVWQVLPLVPTHPEDGSPYNALSAMAGNPALISPEHRAAHGLEAPRTVGKKQRADFGSWCAAQADWLEPYVEFIALRELHDHAPWPAWPPSLRDRDPRSVADVLAGHVDRVQVLRFEQWVFSVQWSRLRDYAASKGVLLFGDLPIFVSLHSADVWGSRVLFLLY
jgi:4-alpha-glucanotransferase